MNPYLCMMMTAFNILGPITNVLVEVEDQLSWTWHVMLTFPFTHVVMCAIELIGMVADVTILIRACHFVR